MIVTVGDITVERDNELLIITFSEDTWDDDHYEQAIAQFNVRHFEWEFKNEFMNEDGKTETIFQLLERA